MKRIDAARKLVKNLDVDAAISAYKDAIIYNEFPLASRVELGKLLINSGELESGLRLLECTYKIFPNKYESASSLGAAYQRLSENVKAAEILDKATVLNPNAPSWVFYGAGKYAADILAFDEPAFAYVPMPKCGSTTIKAHILKIAQGLKTINPHQFFDNPFFKTSGKKIEEYHHHYKFVAVRDPIDRFLSYYNNNILARNSLSGPFNNHLVVFGLNTKPEINELISRWNEYCFVFDDFKHHTLPQAAYLGLNLSDFDDVFLLENIDGLLSKLTDVFNSKEPPAHLMKSEKPISSLYSALSPKSLQVLLDIYKDDYRLGGKLFLPDKFTDCFNK